MDVLATVEQRDYETLCSHTYDVEEVFPSVAQQLLDDAEVVIRLREYELYERITVFRGTTQKHCIDVLVLGEKFRPMTGPTEHVIAEHTVAWPKERGPSSGWDFQIRSSLDRVRQQLREKYGDVEDFTDSVESITDQMGGD